jgi:hypothetical protein
MVKTFSASELCAESGISLGRLHWLVAIGIIQPQEPERFTPGDGFRGEDDRGLARVRNV